MSQLPEKVTISIGHDINTNTYFLEITTVDGKTQTVKLSETQITDMIDKVNEIRSDVLNQKLKNLSFQNVLVSSSYTKPYFREYNEAEVNIYIKDQLSLKEQEDLTNACGEFMEALGYELKAEEEPILNSFWKRLKFVLKRNVTDDDLYRTFRKGKQALELKYVELPTAEQTEKLANAAEKLATTLEKVNEGAILLGNLLAIKKMVDGQPQLIIRQLTSDQVYALSLDPELIKNLDLLDKAFNYQFDKATHLELRAINTDDVPSSPSPLPPPENTGTTEVAK